MNKLKHVVFLVICITLYSYIVFNSKSLQNSELLPIISISSGYIIAEIAKYLYKEV